MAIGNVDSILSKLRLMPDPQLQQFAAMHKNDPFLLPLAIQEDTARKQMRMAAQAQAMGQEPPKVVDQAVAAIGQMPQPQMPQGGPMPPQGGPMPPQGGPRPPMPPQGAGPQGPAGLPTLQAPNVAKMADGGIAGYPDEDEVPRYNGATGSLTNTDPAVEFYSSQMRPQDDALSEMHRQTYAFEAARVGAEQELAVVEAQLQKYGSRQRQQDPEGFAKLVAARNALMQQRDAAAKQFKQQSRLLVPQDESERAYKNPRARTAEEAAIFSNLYATPPQGPMMPVPDVQVAGAPAAAAAPPGAAPRPVPGPGAVTRPAAAAPAATAPTAPAMAPPTVAGAKETAAQFLDRSAIERQSQQYLKEEEAAITQARMRREAAAANQGKAYAGLEALLKKEEEGSKGQLDQAKAFALIDAGLAMAAGRSPNALQNIAEGLGVGSKRYQGAISDFNKAAKERQKAMADIENARRAEARDDAKAQSLFEERADERMANARKFGIDAIMGAGIKSAEIAARIYDTQITQAGAAQRTQMELTGRAAEGAADRATRLQIANIQAAARSDPQSKEAIAVARVQAAINGSPMLKALAEKAKFDPSAAAQYAAEEERLYLRNAPELLIGQMAPGAQSSARSAADAILQKTP